MPSRESRRLVVIRDAFDRQGPFTGSGGHYSPGPATGSPLLAMDRPLDDTLVPPWVFVRSSPFVNRELRPKPRHNLSLAAPVDGFTHRRSLRARPAFTRPCRSFFCAYAELIRGQMPPDDFCNCLLRRASNQTKCPALSSSQGRRPRSPSFSLRTTPPIAEQWHAASRATSASPTPVLVLPGYPSLPSRDVFESAPPPPGCPVGA